MLFDEIKKEWEKDQNFKVEDAGKAAIDTVKLHGRYIVILAQERVELAKLTQKQQLLEFDLVNYYMKRESPEDRVRLGKEHPYGYTKPTAVNAAKLSCVDPLMQTLYRQVVFQDEKVQFVNNIIKVLVDRGWQIKSYIEWAKLKSGK